MYELKSRFIWWSVRSIWGLLAAAAIGASSLAHPQPVTAATWSQPEVAASAPAVLAYEEAHADTFGGQWFNSCCLVVAFTRDIDAHTIQFSSVFPYPDQLMVVQVSHSWRELVSLTEAIAHASADLSRRKSKIEIYGFGPDHPQASQVVVVMPPDQVNQRTRNALQRRYPGAPIVLRAGGRPVVKPLPPPAPLGKTPPTPQP